MKDYKRLTVKRADGEPTIRSNITIQVLINRLAKLEDEIEDGRLFFAPQNQDELLWVSALLMIMSFGDEVKNERLKEIYKELIEIKAKESKK